jgi:hypothetical protein
VLFQPWKNTELQTIAPAAPLVIRQSVRGMKGFRIYNVTGAWWDMLAEGDPTRPIGLIPPFQLVQAPFELDLVEVMLTTTADLPNLPVALMTSWRFVLEFTPDPLDHMVQKLTL